MIGIGIGCNEMTLVRLHDDRCHELLLTATVAADVAIKFAMNVASGGRPAPARKSANLVCLRTPSGISLDLLLPQQSSLVLDKW